LSQNSYGTESTREEDAFDGSKGNDAVSKRAAACITPAEGPFRFLLDAGNLLHGMEEAPLFPGVIAGVRVNEQGVSTFHYGCSQSYSEGCRSSMLREA